MDQHLKAELDYPLVRCEFSKHYNRSPLTLISHVCQLNEESEWDLCCTKCLNDLKIQHDKLRTDEIEDLFETTILNLYSATTEVVQPEVWISQIYESKDKALANIRNVYDKGIQDMNKHIDSLMSHFEKVLSEKRKTLTQQMKLFYESYAQTYEFLAKKYEEIYLNSSLKKLRENYDHNVIKKGLNEVKTAEDYKILVTTIYDLQTKLEEIKKIPEKTKDLSNISICLGNMPFVFDAKNGPVHHMENLHHALEKTLNEGFYQSIFMRNKMIRSIVEPISEVLEKENSSLARAIQTKFEQISSLTDNMIIENNNSLDIPDKIKDSELYDFKETPEVDENDDVDEPFETPGDMEEDTPFFLELDTAEDIKKLHFMITTLEIRSYNRFY